jgi:hypothetical protein
MRSTAGAARAQTSRLPRTRCAPRVATSACAEVIPRGGGEERNRSHSSAETVKQKSRLALTSSPSVTSSASPRTARNTHAADRKSV